MTGVVASIVEFDLNWMGELRDEIRFEDLPRDSYVSRGTRARKYGRLRLDRDSVLELLPHVKFSQEDSSGYDRSSPRLFAPLFGAGTSLEEWPRLTAIVCRMAIIAGMETCDVGIHAIRTTAADGMPGVPAPEGVHRDGCNFIGILHCGADAIVGGETVLIDSVDGSRIELGQLHYGRMVIFDDRRYFHYTGEFHALNSAPCSRDVIVITMS